MNYKIGQRFIDREDNNREYILAATDKTSSFDEVILTSLEDGAPYRWNPVKVDITEKEFSEICNGAEFDFVLKKEKESSMNISDAYLKMQENYGLKVGDKVKVLRKAKSQEMGWCNTWNPEMDKYVNQIGTIFGFGEGIAIAFEDSDFWRFPFFVLEKVEEEYYCIGDEFEVDGEKAILFQNNICNVGFLSLETFENISGTIYVEDKHKITKEELDKMFDGEVTLVFQSPLREEN